MSCHSITIRPPIALPLSALGCFGVTGHHPGIVDHRRPAASRG